mmetsp:Transcript_28100/g.70958  ORF Transcript_28100/g.70958 Transcript_28100/m.70958 type:complete len:124 (+) Transcript_28100:108-479(+)
MDSHDKEMVEAHQWRVSNLFVAPVRASPFLPLFLLPFLTVPTGMSWTNNYFSSIAYAHVQLTASAAVKQRMEKWVSFKRIGLKPPKSAKRYKKKRQILIRLKAHGSSNTLLEALLFFFVQSRS